ncbi:uncharacterized protein PV09_01139 [Verruconis gallopava]|uniref:Abscisic acid G-protein coupled receptor-like domain-containing protein n=1 Tax=Verruconis gallopava TaxID=253628 RepID=A0A0D1XZG5_9PEZI|nr:uncharacterized protein PV09_01139 [Verruconis gallopava]KIW08211.1 hypothetical protein PV09_01139 [Verruconis gallopava]
MSSMLDDDCIDDCVPDYLKRSRKSVLFASLPFLSTFILVAYLVLKRVYPLLSNADDGRGGERRREGQDARLPMHNLELNQAGSRKSLANRIKSQVADARRVSKAVFATTIALSAVLVELILCEISNSLDATARRITLDLTLPTLLVLVIVVAPGLEMRSIIAATGLSFRSTGKGRLNAAWLFESVAMVVWLLAFWYFGHGLIAVFREDVLHPDSHGISEGCLERVGIVGISLMASLAGFAAVSALWQTFGVRDRPVTEADIARKQAGLDAMDDMLNAKKSRLRAITRKMSESRGGEGVITKVVSTIRGNSDSQERSTLQLEISGLQIMRMSLNNSLYSLRNRRDAQLRSHTVGGKLISVFSSGFAVYCAYRLANTGFNILRRSLFGSNTTSQDVVTHFLALLAHYWDASIDQELWSRQISFLLSGIMLLLAFNSALQTFLLLARAFPSLLTAALGGSNFALLVSQVCASYVISSALLLRSNLPSEVRGVITDVLGAPLAVGKVDALFEACFVIAAALTATGIWVGRKLNGPDDDGAAMDGGEMNKMS